MLDLIAMATKATITISPAALGLFMTFATFGGGSAGYYVQNESSKESQRQVISHDAQEHAHPAIGNRLIAVEKRELVIEQTVKFNKDTALDVQSSNEKEHKEIQDKLDRILQKLDTF